MTRISISTAFVALVCSAMCFAACGKIIAQPSHQLLNRLARLQRQGIMVGHQDDTFYGHNWHGEPDRSDVKETAGDYPAVMGFDLGGLENGDSENLDHVSFADIRREIIAQHERGGIVTLSWHCRNFVNGKTAWDPQGGETAWLLDGAGLARLDNAIKKVADFISSLHTSPSPIGEGRGGAVIFRPWHEMNGDWFWWGGKNTTPELYRRFYSHIHEELERLCPGQIVWAFSPNLGATSMEEYYPGDKCVDLVGIDIYDFDNNARAYARNVEEGLRMVCDFAKKHHKLAALTETGCQQLQQTEWFTKTLWPSISGFPISYVLLWRNAWDNHKELYVSYPGHATEPDFKAFAALKRTLFIKDINKP